MCKVHKEAGNEGNVDLLTSERADATGIYTLPIVAQSYDGAAVMTGHVNRVQQKMHPSGLYGPQAEFSFGGCLQGKLYSNYVFSHPQESIFFSQTGTHQAWNLQ